MFSIPLLVIIIFLALCFDFINGFHDTANAIATSISTKALSPRNAIMLAAILNFIGALSGTAVAATIGKNIVLPEFITPVMLVAAILAAIFWNLFTWYLGIPSSSSHALIGGLIGGGYCGFWFLCCKLDRLFKDFYWTNPYTHNRRRYYMSCTNWCT